MTRVDALTLASVDGGIDELNLVNKILIEVISPAGTLCLRPPSCLYVTVKLVFRGDIPSVCVVKKLLGSSATVVIDDRSPKSFIACSLGSGITSSSNASSSPEPNRSVVFPVTELLIFTKRFGACKSSILKGTFALSYALFS